MIESEKRLLREAVGAAETEASLPSAEAGSDWFAFAWNIIVAGFTAVSVRCNPMLPLEPSTEKEPLFPDSQCRI
jgi:hypothetical protein